MTYERLVGAGVSAKLAALSYDLWALCHVATFIFSDIERVLSFPSLLPDVWDAGKCGRRRGKSASVGLLWPQPLCAHYPDSTAWWEAGGRVGGRQHNSIDFPRHASVQFCGKELYFLNVIPPAASLSPLIRLKRNSGWDGMVPQCGQRA